MFKRILLLLAISIPYSAAQAESLDSLAQKSAFVNTHFNWLKDKGAQSAYASENHRCPSRYWVSFKASAKGDTKRNWENEVTQSMKKVGFPDATIQQCVSSGAFVYNSMELQRHSKNKSYKRYVEPAIAVYTEVGSGIVNTMPLMVETYRYDTDKSFKAYDARLGDFCSFTTDNRNATGNCKKFGKLSGQYILKSQRMTIRLNNSKWKISVYTGRDRNYALRNF